MKKFPLLAMSCSLALLLLSNSVLMAFGHHDTFRQRTVIHGHPGGVNVAVGNTIVPGAGLVPGCGTCYHHHATFVAPSSQIYLQRSFAPSSTVLVNQQVPVYNQQLVQRSFIPQQSYQTFQQQQQFAPVQTYQNVQQQSFVPMSSYSTVQAQQSFAPVNTYAQVQQSLAPSFDTTTTCAPASTIGLAPSYGTCGAAVGAAFAPSYGTGASCAPIGAGIAPVIGGHGTFRQRTVQRY